MAEQWLSIVEYARTFAISDMTIRRRIRTGKLNAVLREGKYYIPVQRDPRTQEPIKSPVNAQPSRSLSAVKSHPSSERTYPSVIPGHVDSSYDAHEFRNPVQTSHVPAALSNALNNKATLTVEAKALLEYCESSLRMVDRHERDVEGKFTAKLQMLQEQVRCKDLEIAQLRQQVEDLQFLAQMLERKR